MKNWDITLICNYVRHSYEQDTPAYLHFHNLFHVESVVNHVREIGNFYKLNEEDFFIVQAAAWFHDLGYLYENPSLHEYESVSLMSSFMNKVYLDDIIQQVGETILATRKLETPGTLLGKIIRDADTYHFGTDESKATDDLVRQEMEEMTKQKFPNWKEHTLFLLKNHEFSTTYCQDHLNAGKAKNIAFLEKILNESNGK